MSRACNKDKLALACYCFGYGFTPLKKIRKIIGLADLKEGGIFRMQKPHWQRRPTMFLKVRHHCFRRFRKPQPGNLTRPNDECSMVGVPIYLSILTRPQAIKCLEERRILAVHLRSCATHFPTTSTHPHYVPGNRLNSTLCLNLELIRKPSRYNLPTIWRQYM